MMRAVPVTALLLVAAMLGGCAWTNRDNRPVWNAYEAHLVPTGDAAFWATLPLTVPGGVLAILLDTLVVHPAQVVDDAADDAAELWRRREWQEDYYTELAALPARAGGTPLMFALMFVARSMFDVPVRKSEAEAVADRQAAQQNALRRTRDWLDSIKDGGADRLGSLSAPPPWSDALDRAFADALSRATAAGRLTLYLDARRHGLPPLTRDPAMGLRDADPVVRYLELRRWPKGDALPQALRAALLADQNEMVRTVARARLQV